MPWQAADFPTPERLLFNSALAKELGLEELETAPPSIFAGTELLEGSEPLAQAYAGHQFGGFSPQLGDGRALLLGEIVTPDGVRKDIQLKGSGRTPFSRNGDGKAALGPVLREYLIGEAMHALGVPTTRALAAVTTGEKVQRETALPGAVLTRVAASHIRVGTFQFFAARGDMDKVKTLADYTIERHYPDRAEAENPYLALLVAVSERQAALVAKWMSVGFIHGVMNTDNMALSGETIDYGPCAFMDSYDPKTVFSSIDTQGRYAYANQPLIARWNLARLAETLVPLIDTDQEAAIEKATGVINDFADLYADLWLTEMRTKLGLTTALPQDLDLANDLLFALEGQNTDYTQLFRALAADLEGKQLPPGFAFPATEAFATWKQQWNARLESEGQGNPEVASSMNAVNPVYVPRNHKVEEALSAAVEYGDLTPFHRLSAILSKPFTLQVDALDYEGPAPDGNPAFRTFCGT